MELIRKNFRTKLKHFVGKIFEDNLFLLASSVSYYSALAIAPFLLVILGVASFVGSDVQNKIIVLASEFSDEVGTMIQMIFENVNEGVSFGSISGIIGILFIFWTASLVFLQMRYSMNVIYGHHDPHAVFSLRKEVWDRLFAMFLVLMSGVFLIVSSSLPGIIHWFIDTRENFLFYKIFAFILNIFVCIAMFWLIHYFSPSKRPLKRDALKMGIISSVFFIIGNMILGSYFRSYGLSSIYGAAGTLLVFLIWAYYSSFTLFLSVEVFLFAKNNKKLK